MKSSKPRVESVKPDFRFNSFGGFASFFVIVTSSTVVVVVLLERRLERAEGAGSAEVNPRIFSNTMPLLLSSFLVVVVIAAVLVVVPY